MNNDEDIDEDEDKRLKLVKPFNRFETVELNLDI